MISKILTPESATVPVKKPDQKPAQRKYTVSRKDVVKVINRAGGPLTIFKIGEQLLSELNISVKDDQIKKVLAYGKFFVEVDGRWTIA